MRILFIGGVKFSRAALLQLAEMQVNVVGVCTKAGQDLGNDRVDLTATAKQFDIPVFDTSDINSPNCLGWIKALSPDVIFCFGWSQIIREPLLSLAPFGIIGFHPAPLPENRGRHPIIWSLVLGLQETASTFFVMDGGADSGDIISQISVRIEASDSAGDLYERITNVAMKQIREFVPLLINGEIKRKPQDSSKSNIWRKRNIDDGLIDWRMSAESIYNLTRALAQPYPGAHFVYAGSKISVWKCNVENCLSMNIEPGKVLEVNKNGILVKTGTDSIRLSVIYPMIDAKVGSYL